MNRTEVPVTTKNMFRFAELQAEYKELIKDSIAHKAEALQASADENHLAYVKAKKDYAYVIYLLNDVMEELGRFGYVTGTLREDHANF